MMPPAVKAHHIYFARRHRKQACVVEDPPTAAEDSNEEQQQPPIEEVVTDVKGFPSRPHDTSILRDFENHIALRVWNREERPELNLSYHGRKMDKFGRPTPEIESLVTVSELSSSIACSLYTGDRGLMSTFVERWHKKTSIFHLPVREVTITLDDKASLIHFPIVGAFHSFEQLHVNDVVDMLVELLKVSAVEARAETIQCHYSALMFNYRGYETCIRRKSRSLKKICLIYVNFNFLDNLFIWYIYVLTLTFG
ncbi:Protein MAIN-LIKE 1 [Glycine max]|nr:Protein MAIN-LIKE 1 [Glycine max]